VVNGGFRTWKYVDLRAFLALAVGESPKLVAGLAVAAGVCALRYLVRFWRRETSAAGGGGGGEARVWIVALMWTLLLNVYVPIYDTSMIVLVGVLWYRWGGVEMGENRHLFNTPEKVLLVLLWCSPWFTQAFARSVGFQPYTVVIAAFACYLLCFTRNSTDRDPCHYPEVRRVQFASL
jgi:hypothetical protein